jgi:WD40 repeat protein/transcriptional regulator with XRE-family HTH domain
VRVIYWQITHALKVKDLVYLSVCQLINMDIWKNAMSDFSEMLEEFRNVRQMNKKDLASRAKLTPSYISQLTLGDQKTPTEKAVRALANALDLDRDSQIQFFKVAGYSYSDTLSTKEDLNTPTQTPPKIDLRQAPSAQPFYGRQRELATLTQWIVDDHCQTILVFGIGGIGKTSLVAALTRQISEQLEYGFEYILWRSLHNAPPLKSLLQDCIHFISDQNQFDIPEDIEDQITLLTEYLQGHKCLLVLDNIESILQAEERAGSYRKDYEDYGRLIQRIGKVEHQSTFLLTSREKPRDIAYLEGMTSPTRSLYLAGIGQEEGREILQGRELSGTDESWEALIRLYSGNPLALKLVAEAIQELFDGDINTFLRDEEIAFGDINDLIAQQFYRLSLPEQELLYWLAIEREPIPLENIRENLTHPMPKGAFNELLMSLRRRSVIEARETLFTLQPVVMEYVTGDLIRRACEEFLNNGKFDTGPGGVWMNFAFIKAQTKDYIRDSQKRVLLDPIATQLLDTLEKHDIEQKLKEMLSTLRQVYPQPRGYIAGNSLNLLIYLQSHLRGYDFSHLAIRQAYLQNAVLVDVNFEDSNFITPVFTNTFGNILSVAFNPKGNLLAAGTATGSIWLYEASTRRLLHTFEGHTDGVWSLDFSPDGQTLASSSDDKTIRLWDVSTGSSQILSDHTNRVRSIAFHPAGTLLASVSDDQTIRLRDMNKDTSIIIDDNIHKHTERIWAVAFSTNGDILATGSNDQTIRLWNVNTGHYIKDLLGHTSWIWSVTFSPDGHTLASASEDRTVRLWNIDTGQCLKVLEGHTQGVRSVAFSFDGQSIASGSEDQTIRLWQINNNYDFKILQGHAHGVRSVTFHPHEHMLISGGDDQTIRLWDTDTGQCLNTLQGYTDRVWEIAFSPENNILVSSNEDQAIRLWNIDTGKNFRTIRELSHGVRSVTFGPDGQTLASGGEDQTIRLWQTSTGRNLKIMRGHDKWLRSVAFSPDGTMIASGSEDQTIRLWNTRDGECLNKLIGHTSWVRSVAFHPDGTLLASGSDDQTIRLWNIKKGDCFSILHGHNGRVRSVAFHPNGHIIASGSEDRTLRLWDTHTGECLSILPGHTDRVLSVAFSFDGGMLASGSEDRTLRLWDTHTGECLSILPGHTGRVRSVAFALSGYTFASSSDDGTIRIWDGAERKYLKTLISEKPYKGMKIINVRGLTQAQKNTLLSLGASEDRS